VGVLSPSSAGGIRLSEHSCTGIKDHFDLLPKQFLQWSSWFNFSYYFPHLLTRVFLSSFIMNKDNCICCLANCMLGHCVTLLSLFPTTTSSDGRHLHHPTFECAKNVSSVCSVAAVAVDKQLRLLICMMDAPRQSLS